MSRGPASADTSEGLTVASGPKTRIMMAIIMRPKASMPERTEGLKTPVVRSPMPKSRATTKVLRMPSVRLLMPRLASTTTPTMKSVPAVVRRAAGSLGLRSGWGGCGGRLRRTAAVAPAATAAGGDRPHHCDGRQRARAVLLPQAGGFAAQDDRGEREADETLQCGDEDGEDGDARQADSEGGLLDDEHRDRAAAQRARAGDHEVERLRVAVGRGARDLGSEDESGEEQRQPDADHGGDADEQRLPLLLEVVEADHRAEMDDDEADDDAGEREQARASRGGPRGRRR